MRLIDVDKLERQEYWGNERCFDYVDAEDIDNAPTVDAVEAVRCKDCRKFKHTLAGWLPAGMTTSAPTAREKRVRTMADISIEELGPGVIPEVTKPDGERYRYSIPTWPPGDGGPGYRGHELEIDVFYGGGGGDAEG